jgi:hypothetical protein
MDTLYAKDLLPGPSWDADHTRTSPTIQQLPLSQIHDAIKKDCLCIKQNSTNQTDRDNASYILSCIDI